MYKLSDMEHIGMRKEADMVMKSGRNDLGLSFPYKKNVIVIAQLY